MTDYYCQVHGQYSPALSWSFGAHVTSSLAEGALATVWNQAWTAAWTDTTNGLQQFLPVATEMTGTSTATLNATMHEVSKTNATAVIPGTAPGDTLPYLNSIVVSERGPNIQRHGRGRMYLPAFEETFVNNDILIPAAQTKVSAAVNSVLSALGSNNSSVFVTNKKPLKDGTPAYQKSPINQWKVSNKPARQSRRVKKVTAIYV